MFDALEIAFKRRRRSLSSGAEANGRRVIGPSFSLPFLGHYILARPPSQAQHLAAKKADLSPVRKAMSRARGPQLGRPQMWYRGETRIGRAIRPERPPARRAWPRRRRERPSADRPRGC